MQKALTTIQITVAMIVAGQSPLFGERITDYRATLFDVGEPCILPLERTTVRFETNMGDFDVTLFDESAPNTVRNFLNYVADGDYNNSVIHRSIAGFIVHGGRYDTNLSNLPTDPPIGSEVGWSNVRGTLAMAHPGDPDGATSEWFINLVDNFQLDTQSGGFTVFGKVTPVGMQTVDAIAGLPTITHRAKHRFGLTDLPVLDEFVGTDPSNLVKIHSISVVPEPSASLLVMSSLILLSPAIRKMRTRTTC